MSATTTMASEPVAADTAAAVGTAAAAPAAAASTGAVKRREPMFITDDHKIDLEHYSIPLQYKPYLSHLLLPHGMIVDRADKLAEDILTDYPDSTPHLLVVLKGGSEFAVELTRALRTRHAFARSSHLPFTVDYVRVKSYEGTASTGNVKISGIDLKTIAGRDIILVEDIIDTGITMSRLLPYLTDYAPKSVRVAALLEKRTHRSCGFKAEYVGFSVPDAFVVGYNMDYNEAFRDLPHLCVINGAGIEFFKRHEVLASLL